MSAPKKVIQPFVLLQGGGEGGGGDMSLEVRVAKLESDVHHILTDVGDIKIQIRRLDDKLDSSFKWLNNKMDSNFEWLIGIFLTAFISSFGTLALLRARGFHWL
jgi:hypothetical protein